MSNIDATMIGLDRPRDIDLTVTCKRAGTDGNQTALGRRGILQQGQ